MSAAMTAAPLRVSVVGHVNTGKTSLIAAVSRRSDLAIGDGRTTTAVQEVTFSCRGEQLLVLVDTPGFEMLSEITETLDLARASATQQGRRIDDLEALEEFLATPAVQADPAYAMDVRALEAALGADIILYVVDVTQEPFERLRDEVALLVRTARPVVGVLNFTAEPDTHESAWREVFRREKVHALVAFDVMVNDAAAEQALYTTMATVVAGPRRQAVERLAAAQAGEALRQRQQAIRAAAESLLDILLIEVTRPLTEADPESAARADLQAAVESRERTGLTAIGRAHGYDGDEVAASGQRADADILRDSLFDPEALRRHGPDLLTMAASGAAVGGTIDLMVGGASMFLGSLIGGVVGLVGGFLRRAIQVQERGERLVARPTPELAWLLLARLRAAHDAYRTRTHAHRHKVELGDGTGDTDLRPLQRHPAATQIVAILRAAQRDSALQPERRSARRRAEVLASLETELARLLA